MGSSIPCEINRISLEGWFIWGTATAEALGWWPRSSVRMREEACVLRGGGGGRSVVTCLFDLP